MERTRAQKPNRQWSADKKSSWHCLQQLAVASRDWQIAQLLTQDSKRASAYQLKLPLLSSDFLYLDYAKNRITDFCFTELSRLAETSDLQEKVVDLFSGAVVNFTENRAASHTLLRAESDPQIQAEQQRVYQWVDDIQQKRWLGFSGKPITDVVNIGIGGSDLGPRLTCEALAPYRSHHVNLHFVANLDVLELDQVLARLNPETTLFILCSKSARTQETQINGQHARQWLLRHYQKSHHAERQNPEKITAVLRCHWVAVTANPERLIAEGFVENNIFCMSESIGGRYSIWSAMGLSLLLATTPAVFREFLAGARAMDQHFQTQPFLQNMPVVLALLSVWYQNFLGSTVHAIIPYDQQLAALPAYLQQLVMESNGKSCDRFGKPLTYTTSPIVWGNVGTPSQHSFHQLLHQGTVLCPVDFFLPLNRRASEQISCLTETETQFSHRELVASCLAQSRALMCGQSLQQAEQALRAKGLNKEQAHRLAPHRMSAGNKPSNTFCYPTLTPAVLGALLALYEHKTFVESVIWDINAFDQWGVERGKEICQQLDAVLEHEIDEIDAEGLDAALDASTAQLIALVKQV